jgi:hypothetical protein
VSIWEDDCADGVALAAIQGLAKRNDDLVDRLDEQEDRLDALEAETVWFERETERLTAVEESFTG